MSTGNTPDPFWMRGLRLLRQRTGRAGACRGVPGRAGVCRGLPLVRAEPGLDAGPPGPGQGRLHSRARPLRIASLTCIQSA